MRNFQILKFFMGNKTGLKKISTPTLPITNPNGGSYNDNLLDISHEKIQWLSCGLRQNPMITFQYQFKYVSLYFVPYESGPKIGGGYFALTRLVCESLKNMVWF